MKRDSEEDDLIVLESVPKFDGGREKEIGEERCTAEDRLNIVAEVLLGKPLWGVKGLRGEFLLCVRDYMYFVCALKTG